MHQNNNTAHTVAKTANLWHDTDKWEEYVEFEILEFSAWISMWLEGTIDSLGSEIEY